METKDSLKRAALFAQLSDHELDQVIATSRQRDFAAGATIVREGDPGARGFYLILTGGAIVKRGDVTLSTLGEGDYFGEMALLLADTPRTADVTADGDTTCLVMTQWDFKALLTSHPDISTKVMLELAQRLANTDRAISD